MTLRGMRWKGLYVTRFFHTAIKVISRADMETTLWILQNKGPALVLFTRQTPRSEPYFITTRAQRV